MVKKIEIKDLEEGMYVCGVEKAGADEPVFFMNNILIKNEKDLKGFTGGNHRFVFVELPDEPAPGAFTPAGDEGHFDAYQTIEPSTVETENESADEGAGDASEEFGTELALDGMPIDGYEEAETEKSEPEENGANLYVVDSSEPFEAPPETVFEDVLELNEADPAPGAAPELALETNDGPFWERNAGQDDETGQEPFPEFSTEPSQEPSDDTSEDVPDGPASGPLTLELCEPQEEPREEHAPVADAGPIEETLEEEPWEPLEEPVEEPVGETLEEPVTEPLTKPADEAPYNETPSDEAPPDEVNETPVALEEALEETPPAQHAAQEAVDPVEPIDPVVEFPRPVDEASPEMAEAVVIEDTVAFEEELIEAKDIRNEAEILVKDFMERVRIDGEISAGQVNATVNRMVQSVFKNQDALASLSRLKSCDDYTFTHSVNVCILSLALGRHLGLGESGLQDLGVGAILHDVGKMLVPQKILKKPGTLTEEEFSVMQRHTELGAEILAKNGEIPKTSLLVASHHHERYDGSGYLDKLSGDQIHIYARIAAVADVYDAMTSNRVYQKGMHPEAALRKMYRFRGVHFDGELVERLIKCLGIYPIGTFVELNTGEMAVVRMPNHLDPLKPKVLMLYDNSRRRLPRPLDVDLKADEQRWITSSKNPGPLAGLIEKLIA